MSTAVEYTKDSEAGHTTCITTTLFDLIAALQHDGVDDRAVVPILEHMISSGRIRFSTDGVHSN
jgi:hypothetical protein